jgi:hypothetical protein
MKNNSYFLTSFLACQEGLWWNQNTSVGGVGIWWSILSFVAKGCWVWNLVFPIVFHMVPSCSHQVPNNHLLCSQFVPQDPNRRTLYIPYVLPKVFLFSLVNYLHSVNRWTFILEMQH